MAQPDGQGGIDYPDGGFYSGPDVYPLTQDLGELAVRLNSPISVDRRGTVVLLRDFRYGVDTSEMATAGLGETIKAAAVHSQYGGYSARLERVASVNSYAGVDIRAIARSVGLLGVEALFGATTNYPNLRLYIYRYTGTTLLRWGLEWDSTSGEVSIRDSDGNFTLAQSGLNLLIGYPLLHSMKLVVNEDDLSYTRAIVSGTDITLPSETAQSTASSVEPHVLARFFNAEGPTGGCFVYVDVIIITVNEPP